MLRLRCWRFARVFSDAVILLTAAAAFTVRPAAALERTTILCD